MGSITHRLPATATQAEVEGLVRALNANPAVSGILVQLPLPKGLNEQAVLDLISLNKDVDGFHPMNIGQLVMKGRTPQFIPCTPAGCIELLVRSGIAIFGADAVVVGRSNIVGVPVAALLPTPMRPSPFATAGRGICRTRCGAPRSSWSRPSADRSSCAATRSNQAPAVIDVDINRIEGPISRKSRASVSSAT